jgi:hypothetical protein
MEDLVSMVIDGLSIDGLASLGKLKDLHQVTTAASSMSRIYDIPDFRSIR